MAPTASSTTSSEVLAKRAKLIEKAKLQQLSRQLQMRLQYARLKVDHGWARQNLSEVENLYFHHYRSRPPVKAVTPDPVPAEAHPTGADVPSPPEPTSRPIVASTCSLSPPSLAGVQSIASPTITESSYRVPSLLSTPSTSLTTIASTSSPAAASTNLTKTTNAMLTPRATYKTTMSASSPLRSAAVTLSRTKATPGKGAAGQSGQAALTYDSFWSSLATGHPRPRPSGLPSPPSLDSAALSAYRRTAEMTGVGVGEAAKNATS